VESVRRGELVKLIVVVFPMGAVDIISPVDESSEVVAESEALVARVQSGEAAESIPAHDFRKDIGTGAV